MRASDVGLRFGCERPKVSLQIVMSDSEFISKIQALQRSTEGEKCAATP